jgi:hypothetical protein
MTHAPATNPSRRQPTPAVFAKAEKYLTGGKVAIDVADQSDGVFVGTVQGSRLSPYLVTRSAGTGWRCDCRATSTCAHVLACRAVFHTEEDL